MLDPKPLYFRVPGDELGRMLREHSASIGPDFLCFETFYQAVATTWPRDMIVIDVGGAYGIQGWLFRDFKQYICVDSYDYVPDTPGPSIHHVGNRCVPPDNGINVRADGIDYMQQFFYFHIDLSDVLFLCSAVPNKKLREMVLEMPNSIVWYPGEPMMGTGPFAKATKAEFSRLLACGWHDEADRMVWAAENGKNERKP